MFGKYEPEFNIAKVEDQGFVLGLLELNLWLTKL